MLEHAAEENAVHDGAEHAHVVGLRALDVPLVGHIPTEEVPAADDDRLLHAELAGGDQLIGDVAESLRIQAERSGSRKGAAAELDDDAAVPERGHAASLPYAPGGFAARPRASLPSIGGSHGVPRGCQTCDAWAEHASPSPVRRQPDR